MNFLNGYFRWPFLKMALEEIFLDKFLLNKTYDNKFNRKINKIKNIIRNKI